MAFPKTYLDILPIVSAVKVTVTVGTLAVLPATTEIGIVAVLGAKSSKKQFVFCAKREATETHKILTNNIFFNSILIFLLNNYFRQYF
jgi:hypothetical protein